MIAKPFQDISVGDVATTGTVDVPTVTIQGFADVTGDHHPLHLDADYAAATAFGKPIAHGALVLSLALGLMEFDPAYSLALYGLDRVRFLAPTFVGDTLSAVSTIAEVVARPDGKAAVVAGDVVVSNQRGQTVAVARVKALTAGADY